MKITLPACSLVVLIGAEGSGRTEFARKHFQPAEVLSLEEFHEMVGRQPEDGEADADAVEALGFVLEKRLKNGLLTVIDAPNVSQEDRKTSRSLAKKYHTRLVGIVLDLPEEVCQARNAADPSNKVSRVVVRRQVDELRKSIPRLETEGFRQMVRLENEEAIREVEISRRPMRSDYREETGPFDIIGDVHGCREELEILLGKLGYEIKPAEPGSGLYYHVTAPAGRKAVFVGDLVDRGPDSPGVLKLVMSMVQSGVALCVPGNHDDKLMRKLDGRNVQMKHGLETTMAQLEAESEDFHTEVREFIRRLPSHLQLAGNSLVVAHAGLREALQGRESGGVRSFCLYGETTGETDDFGLPIRYNWAENYRGTSTVVYGHTPIPSPEWLNRTLNIDTGCVFGGKLTALRFPEKELVEVDAKEMYVEPRRPLPLNVPEVSTQQQHDEVLDYSYFRDRSLVATRMLYNLGPQDWQVVAVLEHLTRYGVNPRWLIYLPFTASPPKSSSLPGLLEHPIQAFEYYKRKGVESLVLQEMLPATRAVVVITKDEQVARDRFGVANEGIGVVYTGKGRPYFQDKDEEQQLLARLRAAISKAGIWDALKTNWLCLEVDIMPLIPHAEQFLKQVHAATESVGKSALDRAADALSRAANRGVPVASTLARVQERISQLEQYGAAWKQGLQLPNGTEGLQIAPIHILAGEGKTYFDQPHTWHLGMAEALSGADSKLVYALRHRIIDLDDEDQVREGTRWWDAITAEGSPGMVAKPAEFVPDYLKDIPQPAMWVRGKEALRLLYGPEYDTPEQLERLRKRDLKLKRESTLRELALAYESLNRFVERAPLNEIYQCVFIQLTLHTNAIDPRL